MKHRLTLKVAVLASAMLVASVSAMAANEPDSFGRAVKYLDVGFSPPIYYYTSGTCAANSVCRQITAAEGTSQSFTEADRIVINLPANSTNSLLCFSYSSTYLYALSNTTTAPRGSYVGFDLNVSINSNALFDPLLINKVTGQPFNGVLTISPMLSKRIYRFLQPNTSEQEADTYSRECTNGMISTKVLQDTYGLTLAQAQSVMRSALSVRFSTKAIFTNTGYAYQGIGVRLFGD